MGTLFLAYVVWLFAAVFALLLSQLSEYSKSAGNMYEKMESKVFYNGLISLFVESYSLIAVCCLINLSFIQIDSFGKSFHSLMCITFGLLITLWPIYLFTLLTKYFEHIHKKYFLRTYGALYDEVNLEEGPKVLLQPLFFLLRRMLLAIAVVIFDKVLIWQIMLMALQIVASVIIIGNVRPFHFQSRSNKELFNEIILMFVMYTIICFSPFVPDVTIRFQIGYITIFVVGLHLAVNVYQILLVTVRQLIRENRMRRARKHHKRQRE